MEDALQDYWPEPVVPVQSLSNSGMTAIPNRYVKPPADRPTFTPSPPDHHRTAATIAVPIIDLHGLTAGSSAARLQTAEAISAACKEWGFFQVVNHGVSPELVGKMKSVWREFFHLPMEEKKVYANSPKTYEGYGSQLGVARDAVLDWSDYYFLNLSPESTKWPVRPSSLRTVMEEYSKELMMKVCGTLMTAMSLSLGLPEGYLQTAFTGDKEGDIGVCFRANLYPKCPQPGLTLGLSPHSDPGGLTVLAADEEVGGLQVRRGEGWVDVHPQPNAFIINVGDQIQMISNGIYKSVEHRVTVNSQMERFSMALFCNPAGHLPIAPAAALLSREKPPLYPPTTFDHYRKTIRKKGPCGKSQLDSLCSAATT